MDLQRYKLTIAYRGTHYHGWQTQAANRYYKGKTLGPGMGIPTIQEILGRALRGVVRHPVCLVGSSRTDEGVHAKGQIAHFDTTMTQIPPEGLRRAVNTRLPDDILIRKIEPVSPAFSAIASTLTKRYQYAIWNSDDRPVFRAELAWHRWQRLDREAMAAAARHFIGRHDFTSFARPGHHRYSTIRTIHDCRVGWGRTLAAADAVRQNNSPRDLESDTSDSPPGLPPRLFASATANPLIVIGVEGDGFLWHMVRILVGTLVEVGLGRHAPDDIPAMIAATNRRAAGGTAPPQGLYLQWIKHRSD